MDRPEIVHVSATEGEIERMPQPSSRVTLFAAADVVAAGANGLLARVEAFASDVMKTV